MGGSRNVLISVYLSSVHKMEGSGIKYLLPSSYLYQNEYIKIEGAGNKVEGPYVWHCRERKSSEAIDGYIKKDPAKNTVVSNCE